MIGTALAIASFLQPTPPPEIVVSMLDKSTLIAIFNKQKYLFSGPEHRIRKFNIGNNRIDPELIADGARFKISFPVVEKEIPLPNNGTCEYYFEYPQISGLANESMQNQINQMLKDELIGDEAAPKLFAYQEECTQGNIRELPDGGRTVTWPAFDVRMGCSLEFASGSVVSVYCRHSVLPGAYPVMTYYPITFDLKTGNKLSLNELFAPDSNFAEAIAEGRLQAAILSLEARPESYTPAFGDSIQKHIEHLSSAFREPHYEYYLQSDCSVATKYANLITESCLAFPFERHQIIPYSTTIDLKNLETYFEPNGLLEKVMNIN